MQNARTDSPAKRIFALAIAALLALGTAFAISGCGSDNTEQLIRDGIDSDLSLFKNPTKENLEAFVDESNASQLAQLEAYGIDIYEFLGHALGKFDYQIGDIKIDGNTATADITVTNIDVSAVVNDAIESAQSDPDVAKKLEEVAETGDQAAVMKVVMDYVYSELDAATETITTDTQITLTKNGDTWTVDEEGMSDFLVGVYGNYAS